MAMFLIVDGPTLEELQRSVWNGKTRPAPRVTFMRRTVGGSEPRQLVLTKLDPAEDGAFEFEGYSSERSVGQIDFLFHGQYSPRTRSGHYFYGG